MTSRLENQAGPGKPLEAESPEDQEIAGLVRSGRSRLTDSKKDDLSLDSRFDLAYNGAHALCLALCKKN